MQIERVFTRKVGQGIDHDVGSDNWMAHYYCHGYVSGARKKLKLWVAVYETTSEYWKVRFETNYHIEAGEINKNTLCVQ
jgi:hypothetical protein